MQQNIKPTPIAEIDMVQECFNLLCEVGLKQKAELCFLTHQWIEEAKPMKAEGQRFLLNRYWRLQISICQANTIDERWCLIDTGEMSDWLSLFKSKIIPFCLDNNLPKGFD